MRTAVLHLRAGPVSLTYASGSLRYLRCGGVEVLRQIYFAIRDPQWGTIPGRISREDIDRGADRFHIELTVQHRHEGIDFGWDGVIEGGRDGSVRFDISGTAGSTFRVNRAGFCVLHPVAGCSGRACRIEHTSGVHETARFPALISPHQPFLDVRAISHEVLPGLRAHVRLEGDIFETEDHRNWTDDSFKTYSRPLTLPYPYRISEGERFGQSVSLTLDGPAPPGAAGEHPVSLTIRKDVVRPFPEVAFRRLDLNLAHPAWRDELLQARSGRPIECAVFTHDQTAELPLLIDALQQVRPEVSRWLVFGAGSTLTPESVAAFRSAMSSLYPGIPVGGGSNANFAELNRNRQVADGLDFVSWPINPQVHAADEQTLIDNLQGQASTVKTARSFCGERPLAISTVTIADPTPVAPAWLVASIKHLAEAGVHSITYRDIPGAESVNALLDEFQPRQVMASVSSHPLVADCLALRNGEQSRLILANFLAQEQEILIDGIDRTMLAPYAIASIDGVLES